ncbi:MAG TPA: hypothetical protein DCP90_01700 [Clostridiales bacterium]|nr:MAG: hypothetical protein A2Y22_01885 [Clostridiales bacterium GWD2_32_59]HAN09308.1 hypothetical protein [Clostridiales bacterium]
MDIYHLKNKYIIKLSLVLVFIFSLQCVASSMTIAENRTWLLQGEVEKNKTVIIKTERAALISKEAVIKSEIREIDVQTLKEIEATLETIPETEELIPQGVPVEVLAPPVQIIEQMPTVDNLSDEMRKTWGVKVTGTDQWNTLIERVSKEEGIDPIFIKCVMAIESGGYQQAHNTKNSNGTQDYGLMQVNTSWGSYFDYNKMLYDPEYAIRSGIQVVKCKIASAEKSGEEPTAFEILWRYNGKSAKGKRYAERVIKLYENLSGKTENEMVLTQKPKNA